MWTCPKCQRPFPRANAWHICGEKTVEDIFEGKADNILLAFDDVLLATADWEPNLITAARHAVLFSNKKVWLIVRPLTKWLDVSFHTTGPIDSPHLHRSGPFSKAGRKWRHMIRLHNGGELNAEMVDLLRLGFDWGMGKKV